MKTMNEEIDRRNFLKASALGAAIAGIAGTSGGFPSVFAQTANPSEWIAEAIREYVATSPRNSLKKTDGEKIWADEKAWDEPLIGFASGSDALFDEYKEKVGPFHWRPDEIFNMAFPNAPAKPNELTVIAWVLPSREMARASMRKETKYPSEAWIRTHVYGELFNQDLRRYTVDLLAKSGYPAVAPVLFKEFRMLESEKYVLASNWSERHAAYAAGLGTFSLSDALITARGKAMRCGAIVAKMPATPTPRPYTYHYAYCLHYAKGTCGACIARCPVNAITTAGHDKRATRRKLDEITEYAKERYGIDGYGCSFCQTGTPCESGIPV